MSTVFISYTTEDKPYSDRLYDFLQQQNFDVWYAPVSIHPGENYAAEIGRALADPEDDEDDEDTRYAEERWRALKRDSVGAMVLVLSRASMGSVWVAKEVKRAVKRGIDIVPVKIDNAPLTDEFDFILSDVQILPAYHLRRSSLEELAERLAPYRLGTTEPGRRREARKLSYEDMGVFPIAGGDPYYTADDTLRFKLTDLCFFLAPPAKALDALNAEQAAWAREHFADRDTLLDSTMAEILAGLPIPDLEDRIESSREKVFRQFLRHENGCYYNNKKFGVNRINPFERTEDLSERPLLTIEFFTTDYFTHRVMKDVCKALISEGNVYLTAQLNFTNIESSRIFFTSLGVNLLLLESPYNSAPRVLLTSRSVNAAETYRQHQYSLSVIEGVSQSDYDPYLSTVSITAAVQRGLKEELDVDPHMLQPGSLKFYDFFVNRANLEMGLSCSVELKKDIDLERDVIVRHGKDELLEIADKRTVEIRKLRSFVLTNTEAFLPQAVYTICSYLESVGDFIMERYNKTVLSKQSAVHSKTGTPGPCGDAIVDSRHYIAVIDGATPKGTRLWQDLRGDIYVSRVIASALENMAPDVTAEEALLRINAAVNRAYAENGVDFSTLPVEERLQASVLIYSVHRKEVWSFGDCLLRINGRNYTNQKAVDVLFGGLRAFCVEAEKLRGSHVRYDNMESDYGRERILPFLREQPMFANTDCSFGYDVIDGGAIIPAHVKIYAVQSGDRVTLASDGYPRLFDTLEDTEKYLAKAIREDPECIYELRSTKGIYTGNVSYDDRSYIGFNVE